MDFVAQVSNVSTQMSHPVHVPTVRAFAGHTVEFSAFEFQAWLHKHEI